MTTHRSPFPEDQLNAWLDALASGQPTPVPGEIDATVPAESARELNDLTKAGEAREQGPLDEIWASILSSTDEPAATPTERKAPMLHAMPLTTPNGTVRPIRNTDSRPTGWMDRISQGFATAMVIALLVALVGGVYLREFGLPTGGEDPTRVPGLAASPEAAPDGTLSCASPGYRPVVEGEVDEDALAKIGLPETPLNIDGAHVHVPTSNGEVVTLANTWTPLGGPMWSNPTQANPAGEATIRNIETGEEWTYPYAANWLEALYIPPYLVIPANGNATDFRVIDTESGEETLASEIRGGEFTYRARISQIAVDYTSATWPLAAPAVLLFSQDEFQPVVGVRDPFTDPGTNVLILPADLEDASFARDRANAKYFHETAYAPATNQLAYATEIDGERAIVVIEPGTDDRVELRHPDFTIHSLPLMFSTDGTMLVVSQPGALYTFDLESETPSDPVFQSTFDEPVIPIAHNAESMNVLVQYPDDHVAIKSAISGDLRDFPDVTVPEREGPGPDSALRLSFETDEYELFDGAASTVRFVNLIHETVSPELQVLNPEEDSISASFQPEFQYNVRYPHASWPGGHAYLDDSAKLQVVPSDPDGESWSAPPPAGFEIAENEVASLFTNPEGTCLVLQVATAAEFHIGGSTRSEYLATWIMPLKPGVEWTKLDVQLTGWFPTFEKRESEVLPAQNFDTPIVSAATPSSADATPAATPEGTGTLDGVVIVEGDAEQARIEGDIAIATLGEDGLTLPLENGETVTIPDVTGVDIAAAGPGLAHAYLQDGSAAVVDITTGEILYELPEFRTWGRDFGRYHMMPTDDSLTDWTIIDPQTGDTRLLSEVVDLPGTTVMPSPVSDRYTGDTGVFHVGFGEIDGADFNVVDPTARTFVIAGSLDRATALPDYPTGRQRVGTPVLVDGDVGQVVAYETRGGDSRIIVLDTTTGRVLTRFSATDVGDNPLLYAPGEVMYVRQGNTLLRLSLDDDKLIEITSGIVPGAFGFTKPGSDWITFQTQQAYMLVDAHTGEIVSQVSPPANRAQATDTIGVDPSLVNAEGDTVIVALDPFVPTRPEATSGGTAWLLSPAFPDGLEIAGPTENAATGSFWLSQDGDTFYASTSEMMSGPSELWATPLGEEPAWARIAEGAEFQRFIPFDAGDS